MLDLITKGIEFGCNLNPQFIDIRYQNKFLANYQSKDTELTSNSSSRQGFATRVLFDGSWGFGATTTMNIEDLKKTITEAFRLAKISSQTNKEKIRLAEVKPYKKKIISPRVKSLEDISIEEKITMIKEAEKVFKDFEEIKSYTIGYQEMIDHRIIVNNEGAQIETFDMKPTVVVTAIANRGTKLAPYSDSYSKTKGYELIDEHPLTELADFTAKTAVKNLDASLPKGGPTKVVIDHTSVGIIAHEAVGHCSESDLVEAGSFLKGKIGQKVCSELITIIDDPVVQDAAGWLPFDDEGVKGNRVEIIKEGILTGFLNNRQFAAKMNMKPTGNARAYNFLDEPLIRMRNTYIAPGNFSDEELIEVVGDGLFVTGMMNGSADTSGEFMVGTGQAFEIKNGKLSDKSFVGPTMTGNAFEVLSSTLGVSKDLILNLGRGFCGKEQPAKVDAGGGKLACTVILGGQ